MRLLWCKHLVFSLLITVSLSYVQADELIHIMDNYYQKDERVFEVKDAIIAVTASGIRSGTLHQHTVNYLTNYCAICMDNFPRHDMANLCCHDTSEEDMGCCKSCACEQFKTSIESCVSQLLNMKSFQCLQKNLVY